MKVGAWCGWKGYKDSRPGTRGVSYLCILRLHIF